MKHLGDITKINGAEIEPVDIIVGGSPCQDLSVAGKQKGLAGERSGLFMEQVRIVKEMRDNDIRNGRTAFFARPRYMVWENVPGAFSCGTKRGADFAAVLEEICKIHNKDAHVDVPEKGWTSSGCIIGEDGCFSLAWRVFNAQFWGMPLYTANGSEIIRQTPQRRRRIALVADFAGRSAPEILFEREGMSGDFEPCEEPRQDIAGASDEGAERDD